MENDFLMKRRIFIVMMVFFLGSFTLLIRLGYVQFINGGNITEKAFDLWSRDIPIEGQRGNIYDRNGNLIVGNTLAPSVAVIPRQVKDKDATISFLSDTLGVSEDTIKKHIEKNVSIELIKPSGKKIDVETATKIIEKNLDGVYIVGDTKRMYPYDALLSQVVGFTGIDNQGIAGLEYIYDDYLMGASGDIKMFTDAKGNMMPNNDSIYISPESGLNMHLTIDLTVQLTMERVFENAVKRYEPEAIWGLAMNPKTGEILAMASYPNFDPANYQDYDQETYNRNLPIWMSYEPGSVFKIITYAAGIEEQVFELDEGFYDPGYRMVDGHRIKDWKAGGHGEQTFLEVIQNSCNPGFMEIGFRLGTEKLFEYINKFGFGKKTGVDLLGEAKGIVFDTEIVGPLELATSAFGQGNSVTPIQLVNGASAAVNGGNLMTPYILKGFSLPSTNEMIYENYPIIKERVISEETSETMRYALESVSALGTGRGAHIDGYRVGGKTGTAQKVGPDGKYMENNYILSFLGIAPMNDPEIAVYIAIDNPKNTIQYGGVVAAPLAKEILEEALPAMGIEKQDDQIDLEFRFWADTRLYEVPNFINMPVADLPKSPFYEYHIVGNGDKVIAQIPELGEKIPEGSSVILYTD